MNAAALLIRVLRIARWLLLPYVAGVLFVMVASLFLAGYGLAHAGEGAAGVFLLGLLAAGALAIAVPLLLLVNSERPFWLCARSVALVVMLLVSAQAVRMLWMVVVEPRLMASRFAQTMSSLEPGAVEEQPLLRDGVQVGVRVGVELRLTQAAPVETDGRYLLEALRSLTVVPVEAGSANPLERVPHDVQIFVDGQPLTALQGWERGSDRERQWPAAGAVLPAGRYHVQADLWYAGISSVPGDGRPCRVDRLDAEPWQQQRVARLGAVVQPAIYASLALKYRLGYRGYSHRWPALRTRGDAARWPQQFEQLSIPRCARLKDQLEAERKAAEAALAEQRFAGGDASLPLSGNPLYMALCAGDETAVRRLLAMPVASRYPLGRMLADCTVRVRRPELLSAVLPLLLARTDSASEYCDVLVAVHLQRDAQLAQRLLQAGQPLDCSGQRSGAWRLPFELRGSDGQLVPLDWDDATHAWLALLVGNGARICAPNFGANLLARAILDAPAATLQLLLDAGCDPREPGFNLRLPALGEELPGVNPAVRLWPLRRFLAGRHGVAPLDPAAAERLDRQLGTAQPEELSLNNGPRSDLIYRIRRIALQEPALTHYLLANGVNIAHAAGGTCRTWFTPGYTATDPAAAQLPETKLLDSLSDEQLAELIEPWSLYCDPVPPMPEVRNFRPNGLGTYLCRRSVIACPGED